MKTNEKKNGILLFASIFLGLSLILLLFLIIYIDKFPPTIFIILDVLALLFFFIWIFLPIYRLDTSLMRFEKDGTNFEEFYKEARYSRLNEVLRKIQENYSKGYTTNILNQQAEINYLQRQINPHFLYNSLESIRGNAIIKGESGIAEMTEALATFFRYSIRQKGNLVTLEEEIENVRNYFIIQQFRFNNKYAIQYIIDDSDEVLSRFYIPKLTMQPIVENAIYHGLERKIGNGKIAIRITLTYQRLIINIVDDGIGMPQDKLDALNDMLASDEDIDLTQKDTGIALFNVNKRIKLYFGDKYGLFITSTVDFGTDVEIILPLITSKDVRKIEEES